MEDSLFQKIRDGLSNILDVLINLSGEFGIINEVLIGIIIPAVGIMISASAAYDLTKMKNPRYAQKVTPGSVAVRFVVGPTTVLFSSFMMLITRSILGDRTPDSVPTAMTYSAEINNAVDPTAALLLAITSFLVLVGWIAGLRAMMAFARCANPQQDGHALFKAGAARLLAASFLCMFQFFMDDIVSSLTGSGSGYSSALNL